MVLYVEKYHMGFAIFVEVRRSISMGKWIDEFEVTVSKYRPARAGKVPFADKVVVDAVVCYTVEDYIDLLFNSIYNGSNTH